MTDITNLATALDDAAVRASAIAQLSFDHPALDVATAYRIARASIDRRVARGERIIGIKMGFTSRAKMAQMGVEDLIWGWLTDAMLVADGGSAAHARFIHPRIEPELAVRLKAPLHGEVTAIEAWGAVEAVAPALEIIDSRYRDFRFSLVDVVADNASSAAFVVGGWQRPDLDIANLGMVMSIDGAPVQFGSSAAILGYPQRSLVAAARLAGEAGFALEAGWTVLLGAATTAEAVAAGARVRLETQDMATVDITLAGAAA
ncbi:fumarylacetoacetate hydrolase family protein [Sphingomonas sp. AR_OL41]|uniref:2-keto-4-pentenoate hydratase n=1 Tax=Sphingomonas sp. AR_OL41 TaxID=3042729 RepID=UPI0024802DC1|nr:fumarylacetoacetate hydrolase family protein [Sphingomonas sp. AR_OL41]MDH7972087.1 fumarylacetoacetate hydrolase family protein [Sphingomonas sp. AR_OL41]